MQKPKDYDDVREYGEQKALEPGGHILIIKKIEDTLSSTGKQMLVIYFDTADRDKQPRYFKERYDSDTRDNKAWGGRVWQLIYDNEGKTNQGFKTFITAVEKSNSSAFKVQWNEMFCDCFKDKLVGGVFRREEFLTKEGKSAWAVKCCGFRSVAAIDEGVEMPADKPLKPGSVGGYPVPQGAPVTLSADDDYPF